MARAATLPPQLILASLGLMSLLACGKSGHGGRTAGDAFGEIYLNQPVRLPLADARCQESAGLALTAPAVRDVSYGLHIRDTIDQREDETHATRHEEITVLAKPKAMLRCPGGDDNRSVEGVTRVAMGQVDRAYRFYDALPGAKQADRLSMVVLPLYEYATRESVAPVTGAPQERKERGYVTDNASWSLGSRGPVVTIYPQSEERAKRNEAPTWELPMVLAHEYGHDVFHRHFPRVFSDVSSPFAAAAMRSEGLVFNPHDPVAGLRPDVAGLAGPGGQGNASLALALTAVNEGFADVFGFYAIGQAPDALPLRCFRQSRDVASPSFNDGVAKVIDAAALTSFIQQKDGTDASSQRTGCDRTRWRQTHTFGSAWAHGIDQALTAAGVTESQAKAAKLLAWLDRMEADFEDGAWGAGGFLDFSLRSFVRAAADGAAIAAPLCQALDRQFPAFTGPWRATGAKRFEAFATACPAP